MNDRAWPGAVPDAFYRDCTWTGCADAALRCLARGGRLTGWRRYGGAG